MTDSQVVMVITSIKTMDEIRSGGLLDLPISPTLETWGIAWNSACTSVSCEGPKGYFWNSMVKVIPAVLISTMLGTVNGYVLTQWRFKGSDLFFGMLLTGCFIPFQVVLLPVAKTLGVLGISGTLTGLVFVHVVYGTAFTSLPACSATITMYETTGPDTLIFIHMNETNVVSRVQSSSEYRIGDTIRLKFDTSKAIIFDPETEVRIV